MYMCGRVPLKAELSLLPFVFCYAPLQANINQQCSDYPVFSSVFYTLHSSIHRHTSTLFLLLPFFFEASFSNCFIYVKNKKLPTLPPPPIAPIALSNKMVNSIDATLRSHDLLWICLYNLNRSQFIFCALEWKQQAITIPNVNVNFEAYRVVTW